MNAADGSEGPLVWHLPLVLRLGILLCTVLGAVACGAFFLHAMGVTHGDRKDYFDGTAENLVAGIACAAGSGIAARWAFRARIELNDSQLLVYGPVRTRRIQVSSIRSVRPTGRGDLYIAYTDRDREYHFTTAVTEGILGVRIGRHKLRVDHIAKVLNDRLEQS